MAFTTLPGRTAILEEHAMRGSMARSGNPSDNAQVESFFKRLKHEEVFPYDYQTMDSVMRRLPDFLE